MKKEEKTLKVFMESIPALEKSELGVLRGGFGAIHGGGISDPMGNGNCGINCGCENPYCHLIKPHNGDYDLALSFM